MVVYNSIAYTTHRRRPGSASCRCGSSRRAALGKHKPGRIKPGRIKRAALSLQNQNYYICCFFAGRNIPAHSNYRYIFLGPVFPPICKSGSWEQPRLIRPRLYSSEPPVVRAGPLKSDIVSKKHPQLRSVSIISIFEFSI